MEKNSVQVVLAAGGNPTGIMFVSDGNQRDQNSDIAKDYMSDHPDVEQLGIGKSLSPL